MVMARGPKATPLTMSRRIRRELKLLTRRQRAPFVEVQRARIVLLARDGVGTSCIARRVGCDERTVRKWKARFRKDPRIEVLSDLARSGRPMKVTIATRCELVQLACERPVRLVAQDTALSRREQGFETPRERHFLQFSLTPALIVCATDA